MLGTGTGTWICPVHRELTIRKQIDINDQTE